MMTLSRAPWLPEPEKSEPGRLSRPTSLRVILGVSIGLWTLIAVGLGGF